MIPLDQARQLAAPYPLLCLDECLPPEVLQALLSEFPTNRETRRFSVVMGGRSRLCSDELEFHEFLEQRPAWRALYDHVNSEAFVQQVLERFDDQLAERGCSLQRPIVFDPLAMKREAERRASDRRLWRRVLRKLHLLPPSEPEASFVPGPGQGDLVFVHFDLSAAGDGYAREVHRDMDNRIAAFLIYFSDADEVGGEGGQFGIHRLRAGAEDRPLPRQPQEAATEVVDMLEPARNRLVMFLSTPDSYHSVPRMHGTRAQRRFIYVGITAGRDLRWSPAASGMAS